MTEAVFNDKVGGKETLEVRPGQTVRDLLRANGIPANAVITYLNGEIAQQGSAADLIWPISYLLADVCRVITLEPGDVVLSGTPAHSRPMEPGDVVEVEVTGLGRLSNTVVDWDVDLSGPGDQLQVSANTLHVALAMPEDEAERAVQEGVTRS